jgi:hypothetical protein
MIRPTVVLLSVVLFASVLRADPPEAPAARSDDRFFAVIFSSESCPRRARYTHTWATIVKASPDDERPHGYRLEALTISWMPASLRIRPLALRAECGVNLSLQATLDDCFRKGERVVMWGPYDFHQEAPYNDWERIAAHIARLNSGRVLYKAVDPDTGPRSGYVSNCIHAVTDLDRHLARPSYNELQRFGFDAGRFLVEVLASRKRIDLSHTHPWVADALGIDARVRRQSPLTHDR